MMQRVLNGLDPMKPDPDIMCEECDEQIATWIGLVFRGTQLEPPEYIVLCDEHGGDE